jgi:hypothetical protein
MRGEGIVFRYAVGWVKGGAEARSSNSVEVQKVVTLAWKSNVLVPE